MKHFKNTLSLSCSILVTAVLLSACGKPDAAQNESTTPGTLVSSPQVKNETYVLDKKESEVSWKGYMQFVPKNAHNGFAGFSSGELAIDKGQLVGGTFEVDMNTITDEKHQNDNNLIDHIKSEDFFDAKKFPTSVFVITSVAPTSGGNVNVTGNLTMKGITHEVAFPAKITVDATTVTAGGKLTIDRSKWDVRYGSGKFFSNLADETISDDIEFDVKVVARKK